MKHWLNPKPRLLWLALLSLPLFSLPLLGLAGCATNDPENLSSRPWNTPKNWEHGLPTGMYEGR